MPLDAPKPRQEIHHRSIDMRAFLREDGLYEVEARLVDVKPFDFLRFSSGGRWPANAPLHDMTIRLAVDGDYVVREIQASSDITPYNVCKEAQHTLAGLIGERIAKGWSARVKSQLRGAASCTHLMEMLMPMGTTVLQGIWGMRKEAGFKQEDAVHKIDSCYAYGAEREVVQRLWPERHRPAPRS